MQLYRGTDTEHRGERRVLPAGIFLAGWSACLAGISILRLTRTAGPGDYVNDAFPTKLGCISVQADGPGLANPVLLPLAYVDPTQINAQMPDYRDGAGNPHRNCQSRRDQ